MEYNLPSELIKQLDFGQNAKNKQHGIQNEGLSEDW